MIYVDANVILRYFLQDNEKMFEQAKDIIETNNIFILNEVLAEIIYVLTKTYAIAIEKTCTLLKDFISCDNVRVLNKPIIFKALEYFQTKKIDFVDCILVGYAEEEQAMRLSHLLL
jgi:predicted nucleic-acid-binding protein